MWRKLILIGLLLAALSAVAAVPAVAQNGATWTGQYYNNPYLLGDPAFTRQESSVSFNWGTNSPGQGVGADGFSVRWATDVFLPAGTYRFWALADDNIRVTVDFAFNPLFDTFANPAVGQVVSGDVTLEAGSHHIQVDYREQTGDAYAYVTWANLATNPTGPNFPFNPPPPQVSGQWTAQYYTNPTLFGQPAVVRGEASPSNNWGGGSPAPGIPADNFSARWTSNLGLGAGTYRITARADDGVRVFVNGSMVINQWALATGQTYTADITLGTGTHNVVVEYFEVFGDAFLEFNLAPIGAPQPPVVPPGGSGGAWLGYYFNNTNLSGSPAAILTVNAPGGNWGTGSPLPSVQADNFSVRWITTQTFAAGVYRVTVRADDGVRVLVNGGLVIDRWGTATGQTYTADVTLNAGQHTITVEFLELGGVAFLEYSFAPASATPPTPPPAGGASGSATVTAFRLNVRSQPSAGADILTKISRNETFPIVGCNTDRSWWQINVNGTIGWVSGRYINTANANCSQPGAEIQPSPTGYNIVAATNLNVRVGPSTRFRQIATMRAGESAAVVGRNASSTWWEVDYKGIVGWVIGSYGVIQGTPDLGRIPVTE